MKKNSGQFPDNFGDIFQIFLFYRAGGKINEIEDAKFVNEGRKFNTSILSSCVSNLTFFIWSSSFKVNLDS